MSWNMYILLPTSICLGRKPIPFPQKCIGYRNRQKKIGDTQIRGGFLICMVTVTDVDILVMATEEDLP